MPTKNQQREFNDLMESEMTRALVFDASTLDAITEWIEKNLDPEDVFTDEQLEKWATDNGYVKQ